MKNRIRKYFNEEPEEFEEGTGEEWKDEEFDEGCTGGCSSGGSTPFLIIDFKSFFKGMIKGAIRELQAEQRKTRRFQFLSSFDEEFFGR